MRIIAITAGKGGVGKTTMTANLGVSLVKMGFKTCVLDANFTAPDLAIHFGLVPEATLWDVLEGKEKIENAVYVHDCGLHIVPGSTGVEEFSRDIYKRLKRKMRTLKYDFILLDTPPGLGDDAKAALEPAREVLVVANPEWTSLGNAYKITKVAQGMKKKMAGLVLNRRLAHEYEPSSELIERFLGLPIVGEIPEDVAVRKSISLQNPVAISYPEAPAARGIEKVAAHLGGIDYRAKSGLLHRLISFLGIF